MLPPPIEITESAWVDFTYSRAFSVMWEGVCIVASVNMPATLPLRRSFSWEACVTCWGVERRSGAERLCRATSSESFERVPLPNMTRAGAALYSKASIVYARFYK